MKKYLKANLPRLINLFRILKFELLKNKKIHKSKWGFYFTGNESMARGDFEVFETQLLRDLLDEVDVFVNIGANIGYYCCHALSLNKHSVAFEPMPNNLYYLYKNIKINNWNNIKIFPVALSNENGITKIFGNNTGASLIRGWGNFEDSFYTYVPKLTLDEILLKKYCNKKLLFMIDIEGSELEMLQGALITIKQEPSPIWIVEIVLESKTLNKKKNIDRYKKTFDMFLLNGYKSYSINGVIKPFKIDEILKLKSITNDLPFNFLFKK